MSVEVSAQQVKTGDVVFLKTMKHTFLDVDPADEKVHAHAPCSSSTSTVSLSSAPQARVRWTDMGDWQRIVVEKEGGAPPCAEGFQLDSQATTL